MINLDLVKLMRSVILVLPSSTVHCQLTVALVALLVATMFMGAAHGQTASALRYSFVLSKPCLCPLTSVYAGRD
jgi:hypothetical protein